MALSAEEKERFLRAVEEDREFRYALMGLLGFKELLERFARLEERQARLEERQQRLEERQQRLEERQQRLEERFAKLEERQQKLEERFAKLEERQQKLEERFAKLEERFARLEERQQKLEERQQRLEEELVRVRRLAELNRRDIGALTEATLSRWVWEDLRDELVERGETVVSRRRNARVDNVDIDLLVETSKRIYVVEVKIQPNHHDINELVVKARKVMELRGKEAVPVLASVWIGDETARYAEEKGVKVIRY